MPNGHVQIIVALTCLIYDGNPAAKLLFAQAPFTIRKFRALLYRNGGLETGRLLRERKGWLDPTERSSRRLVVFPAESEQFPGP
ncbi:hypothetical protein LD39_04220, partial [Halobacillus sp. BBL2006]